jgi:hypothetical protein
MLHPQGRETGGVRKFLSEIIPSCLACGLQASGLAIGGIFSLWFVFGLFDSLESAVTGSAFFALMSAIFFVPMLLLLAVTILPLGYFVLRAANLNFRLAYILLVGFVLSLSLAWFLVRVSGPNEAIIFVRNALWGGLWYLAAVPLSAFICGIKLFKDLCEPEQGVAK